MREMAGLHLGRAKDAAVGAAKTAEEFLSPAHLANWWKGRRMNEIENRFFDLLDRFRRGEIGLEETRKKASEHINKIEKMFGRKTAEMYRKHFELTVLDKEFRDVVRKFKRGEISQEEAKKRLMEIANNIEKIHGKKKADFYRKYAEEVLTGKRTESMHTEEGLSNKSTSEMNRNTTPVEMNGNAMNGNRLGEIGRKDTERRSMQTMNGSEKSNDKLGGRRWAGMYDKKYVEEVLSGRHREPRHVVKERGVEGRRQHLVLLERPIEKYIEDVRPNRGLRHVVKERGVEGRRQHLVLLERPIEKYIEDVRPNRGLRHVVKERGVEGRRQHLVLLERPIEKYIEDVRPKIVAEDYTPLFRLLGVRHRELRLHRMTAAQLEKPKLLYTALEELETTKITPKRRRRIILPVPSPLETETPPQYDEPLVRTPMISERVPRYKTTLVSTFTTPTTANVPSPSTYPPVTVPRISEVPTVGVPPAPINEKSPTPRQTRLPFGWWSFLPPWKVADDRAGEGAYKVQEGKRQILALA
jgi:polyhydroxyalkanoate synthesis regulator phasin